MFEVPIILSLSLSIHIHVGIDVYLSLYLYIYIYILLSLDEERGLWLAITFSPWKRSAGEIDKLIELWINSIRIEILELGPAD